MELENVILDVAEWNSSPDVKDISEDNLETYLKKINSYTGDYLQEYDYWWAEGERQRLKQLWLNTALCVGQWYEDQQKFSEALTTYLQINRLNPASDRLSIANPTKVPGTFNDTSPEKKTKYTWWGNYGILHSTELSTYEKLKKHL
ncbi:bacterial transcriptional activator domain-containing protein [Paenibacillus sp. UASWS1643]|uniref:bacterial transcriptional activator domain-containing protein n=1 Tax=Paenibacillus sp. UASWS1643 TaxID=2580422 RepID=UPI0012385A7E|nr:hypothetical protein [Paenibacillus sp. UASWS1643]KAA8748106.1 hypothetical protein FE296_18570 [Paenibacillus sp. UASWS1643]